MAKVVDTGVRPPKPKTMPLQFKRATDRTFFRVNPILLKGEPAYEWNTHKLKVGDGETKYNQLPYIGDHSKPEDGKSAYDIWIDEGHTGTIEDFLESLIGEQGKSTYEIWLSLGHEGTVVDFINDIQGESAYEVWIDAGHTGTVTDFLDSLVGKSAYDIWISLGHQGTEQDFIDSLKGESAYQAWLNTGHTGTEEDFVAFMQTASWDEF
jgi:hypothetical protein